MTQGHGSTVDGVLRRSARRTPARVALKYGERVWTYAELDDAVSRAAALLLAQGLERGDRVAAYGHNSDAYLIAFLGCARAGLVHVPVNQNLTGADLGYLLDQSGSALTLTDPALADRLPAAPAPSRCATPRTPCSPAWQTPRRTPGRSRAPRTWCNCCTPPAPPRCPRAR